MFCSSSLSSLSWGCRLFWHDMQLLSAQALKIGDSFMVGGEGFQVTAARFKEGALDIEDIEQTKFSEAIAFFRGLKRFLSSGEHVVL